MAVHRVIGHFTGKKLEPQQFLVSTATVSGTDGAQRPNFGAILTVLASHGLVPGGTAFVIDSVANLDPQYNTCPGILT